jgi:catechol 2,3-dioxygenase-like lactoylglutathione lyase family enzyme
MSQEIRAAKLHHASIRVADVERSRRFYEGLLGMRRAPRPDMGFPGEWYALGEGQLHLIQIPKQGEGIDPSDPHFAVAVADLAAAKTALEGAGVPFVELPGAVWIRDPDGYTVELREN